VRVIGHGISSGGNNNNNIVASDFANKDPSTLTVDFVHATGPDTIGNYWVKEEIMNNQKSLQNLKITSFFLEILDACLR
jgi:hypothetical protein